MRNYAELLNNIIIFVLGMVAGYELIYAQLHWKSSRLQREIDAKIQEATSEKIHEEIEQFYRDRAETGEILGQLCEVLKQATAEVKSKSENKQTGDKNA